MSNRDGPTLAPQASKQAIADPPRRTEGVNVNDYANDPRYSSKWWAKFSREQLRPLAILLLVMFAARSSLADWNTVPSGSMKPTIIEGDRVFVNKLAYDLKVPFTNWHLAKWADPKRGEIVVLDSPEDGIRLIKRVVGVPGDVVQLIDNHLLINGQPSQYGPLDQNTINQVPASERGTHGYVSETMSGVSHAMMTTPPPYGEKKTYGPKTVPPGQYFVLGDNRDQSKDSRFIGFVPRGNIVGRASRVVMSLNYDNYFLPRTDRFFRKMP